MALNKQTLSEQIYDILREDILQQRIPCGQKLTLKALQERFGVSSTPIREALTRLSDEQLVSYYSNVGVSVVELNHEDLKEIYQFMTDLDCLAIRYASKHPDQNRICNALSENLALMKACDSSDPHWQVLSDNFHLIFYEYCQNTRLIHSAERMRSQLSIMAYQYEKDTQVQAQIYEEHKAVAEAYLKKDSGLAAEKMREHLLHSFEHAATLMK